MALHLPTQEVDQRRFSSLSEIRFNARSFLEGFPTPTPSSRYSHQSLPEHTEREHRRRSSGFNAIRDMLSHGRHAPASARSSTSHLPLTHSEDSTHEEHDHHDDDEDEELDELENRPHHHSMVYSPLSRPQSWHIAPPTEPHPALLRPREPLISPPPFGEERDLEAQTTTTNTSPAAQRRRKKKKKRSNGGYWLRRTPGTTRQKRETCVPDTIKGRTTGTMVTGFVLIVLISTCKDQKISLIQ